MMNISVLVVSVGVFWGSSSIPWNASSTLPGRAGEVVPIQIPFTAPPEAEFPDLPKATPAPEVLSEEDLKRAEALLPMLEGRQELYAIGEFVHLGKPVVPVVVKALTMPGPRVRYNAIEVLKIINDPQAIPDLLKVAMDVNEMTRIRAHALRTAVRLDAHQVLPAFQKLYQDESDTIRRTVAFESRYVKVKEVVPILIKLLGDPERFVAVTALESFWVVTRYVGKPHNWEGSTQEERKAWAKEWQEWWDANQKREKEQQQIPSENPMPS